MKIRNLLDEGEIGVGLDWVLEGDGEVRALLDARSVLFTGDRWMVRHDVPAGADPPQGFEPGHEDGTGGYAGWAPLDTGPAEVRRAVETVEEAFPSGVYLVTETGLVRPGAAPKLPGRKGPRSLTRLRRMLAEASEAGWAGLVFEGPDGQRAKLKVGALG